MIFEILLFRPQKQIFQQIKFSCRVLLKPVWSIHMISQSLYAIFQNLSEKLKLRVT